MRPLRLLLVPLIALAVAGSGHSWAWKQADLDRNALNLALFRGAETADVAASSVEHGKVVDASGTPAAGDLTILVRYEQQQTDWTGGPAGVHRVCYRFTSPHGDNVKFRETGCPDESS